MLVPTRTNPGASARVAAVARTRWAKGHKAHPTQKTRRAAKEEAPQTTPRTSPSQTARDRTRRQTVRKMTASKISTAGKVQVVTNLSSQAQPMAPQMGYPLLMDSSRTGPTMIMERSLIASHIPATDTGIGMTSRYAGSSVCCGRHIRASAWGVGM
ncbi:unnamed protein product [Amoebophrya sp. A25]|nr:unnamed protein product [Amoebophrya sp. A25]|eukprot:GSA25T00010480001.1